METVKTDWWNVNLPREKALFEKWLKGFDDTTRLPVRAIVKEQGFGSVLDCGCGLCAEYDGFVRDGYPIQYTGLDTCEPLIKMAQERGVCAMPGDIEAIPMPESSFDVVMCRGVLEHLDGFVKALREMIRVAKYEVLISWFIPPGDVEERRQGVDRGALLRHNTYRRFDVDAFIQHLGCRGWVWSELPDGFALLRIIKEEVDARKVDEVAG